MCLLSKEGADALLPGGIIKFDVLIPHGYTMGRIIFIGEECRSGVPHEPIKVICPVFVLLHELQKPNILQDYEDRGDELFIRKDGKVEVLASDIRQTLEV